MKISRWWLVAAVLGVVGCQPESAPEPGTGGPGEEALRECPKEWTPYLEDRGISFPDDRTQQLSGPSGFQDVPEFHDCQRFVQEPRPGASRTYSDGAFAIFAVGDSTAIGEIPQDRSTLYQASADSGQARPAAQIYAPHAWTPLRIQQGLNCVFLFRVNDDQWEAFIRADGSTDQGCHDPIPLDTVRQYTPLQVLRESDPELGPRAYPLVARWTWYQDGQKTEYRMGVSCDDGWCEILPRQDNAQAAHSYAETAEYDSGNLELRRVREVKAWYDEQILAESSSGVLVPSQILGTIIPDPRLGQYDSAAFAGHWLPAAQVALTPLGNPVENPYEAPEKLNFSLTPGASVLNTVSLCNGPWSTCRDALPTPPDQEEPLACDSKDTTGWWAELKPRSGNPVYRCVSRCPYGILVPGTARWSWRSNDEGMWMRCVNGCCEVGFGFG